MYTEKITQPYYIFPLFSMQYTHFFYMLLNNVTIKMTITDYSSGKNTCFRLHILTSCNDWKWKYIWNKQGSRCKCLCILKKVLFYLILLCVDRFKDHETVEYLNFICTTWYIIVRLKTLKNDMLLKCVSILLQYVQIRITLW